MARSRLASRPTTSAAKAQQGCPEVALAFEGVGLGLCACNIGDKEKQGAERGQDAFHLRRGIGPRRQQHTVHGILAGKLRNQKCTDRFNHFSTKVTATGCERARESALREHWQ